MTRKPIPELYAILLQSIKDYESDTFSATASRLKPEEAEEITKHLVSTAIQSLIDCDTLDGVRLSIILEDIRDKQN